MTAPYPPIDGTQACAQVEDPELFFPNGNTPGGSDLGSRRATFVCRRCPFLRPCLAYALTHDVVGVWGGTNYAERDRIRREHAIEADRTGLQLTDYVRQSDVVDLHRGGSSLLTSQPGSASASTPSTPISSVQGGPHDHH